MNKIIEEQLKKVEVADLSDYNSLTGTYFIKKRVDVKIEEDKCYLIRLKPTAFTNYAVLVNWNKGNNPIYEYMKIDVSKKMGKMIKVVGIKYDYANQKDDQGFWSGWLLIDDLEVISKL